MEEFNKLAVSTQTFIVKSVIEYIDLKKCYDEFNIVDNLSVVSIKYKLEHRGIFDKEKPIKPKAKNFLNCVTLSILLDKKLNVKIFNNGVFQFTGCKHYRHVVDAMAIILRQFVEMRCYRLCQRLLRSVATSSSGDGGSGSGGDSIDGKPIDTEVVMSIDDDDDDGAIVYYIVSAMRNIDFELGFKIDRQAFGNIIEQTTDYFIPPMTSGYMGVKIKIPVLDTTLIYLPKIEFMYKRCYDDTTQPTQPTTTTTYSSIESTVSHDIFYTNIFPKRKPKSYFVSISVFQNGKVLMSGLNETVQRPCYEWFVSMIDRVRGQINLDKPLKTFCRAVVLRGSGGGCYIGGGGSNINGRYINGVHIY